MTSKVAEMPTFEDKEAEYVDNGLGTVPTVPLDAVEGPTKSRGAQLLAVLISGVALFSDGYNIQVTGRLEHPSMAANTLSLHEHYLDRPVPRSNDHSDENPPDELAPCR